MADIMHQIQIQGTPAKLYEALTTPEGLASWWTADVEAEPREGSTATFGFNHHTIVFRMKVECLVPEKLVQWKCVGDIDEWKETQLSFEIEPRADGIILKFTHGDWKSTEGAFRICNTDWGRLMYYLKDHVEGRSDTPMMG